MLALQTSCFPDVVIPNKMIDFSQSKEPSKLFNSIAGVYGLAIAALEYLKVGKLDEFDSLATDCSCHLRALKISILIQDLSVFHSDLNSELDRTLEELKAKYEILKMVGKNLTAWCQKGKKMSDSSTPVVSALQELKTLQSTDSYCFSIHDVLEKMEIKTHIHLDLLYVIHAFTLKLVKDYQIVEQSDEVMCSDHHCGSAIVSSDQVKKEVTNLTKLTQYLKKSLEPTSDINEGLIKKDVYRLAKKHLTDLSADCILQETAKLSNDNTHYYLSHNQKIVEGKIELPDFYSLTGTFQVCLQKQIPVLLKVKKCVHAHRYQELDNPFDFSLYLVPDKEAMKFKSCSFSSVEENGPLIVVEGKRSGRTVIHESTSDYVERLMNDFDFMKICAWDGAQHKQYTSDSDSLLETPSQVIPSLKEDVFESERIDALRVKAAEVGCAFSNQSLLILSHIFADTIHNQKTEICSLTNHCQFHPETKKIQEEGL